MEKSRTKVNLNSQKENYIDVKKCNTKTQKSKRNRKQTLQQKYRNILGHKQPIVLLKKCLFLKNIFYKSTLQDLTKNSVDNRHDTSKLIYPANHVSHQSPHVEETICNDLIHNSKAVHTKSSKKNSSKTKKSHLINNLNDDCIKFSEMDNIRITLRNNNCSLNMVPSDTKISNNISKTVKACTQSNISMGSKRSILENVATCVLNKMKKGQTQENNLIAMENVEMPCIQNRNERKQKGVSVCSILTNNNEDKEYSDSVSLQEGLHNSNNSFLTEHNVDSTVEHPVEHTALEHPVEHTALEHPMEHTAVEHPVEHTAVEHPVKHTAVEHPVKHTAVEHPVKHTAVDLKMKKSKNEISPLHNRNATRTTVVVLPSKRLDTTTLEVNSGMFYSKKLKMCTEKHTTVDIQKDPIAKDEASLVPGRSCINFADIIQSSECLGTEILKERFTTPYSNNLSEQNTKKHTTPDTEGAINIEGESDNVLRDALHRQYGNSWMKQGLLHGKDNNIDESMKKVKLNRSAWYKTFGIMEDNNDTSKKVKATNKDVDLNNNKEVPELIPTDAPRMSAAVAGDANETFDVPVAEENLTDNRGAFSTGKQNLIETFGYNNLVESGARTDAEQLPDLATETCKQVSVQDTSSVSGNGNFNTSNLYCDDDDYISLYAESMLIEEYDVGEPLHSRRSKGMSQVTENQYVMSDKTIDNYYKNNALEFNEAYDMYASNSKTDTPQEKQPFLTAKKDINSNNVVNRQVQMNQNVTEQQNQDIFARFFRGYCYTALMHGRCLKNNCHFRHDFLQIMSKWYDISEKFYFTVIDELVLKRCNKFLQKFCEMCIGSRLNIMHQLKILKKLYNKNIITVAMVYDFIKKLKPLKLTVKQIVDNLATIVDASDTGFINCISQIIFNLVTPGEIWITLKPLLMRVEKLDKYVVEIIVTESIRTMEHIQDIYENVLRKLDDETFGKIQPQLLLDFDRLFTRLHVPQVQETVATNAVLTKDISSPDPTYEPKIVRDPERSHISSTIVWHDVLFDSRSNAQPQTSPVVLHPMDNVSEPYSRNSRERFWKFYLDVHSLQEGLKYSDYDHVKSILDAAQALEVTPFTRACYNILLNKVEHAQNHLSKLASLAVQEGATPTFCKILIEVTIRILAVLAERELWVLALELLKNIEIVLHQKSNLLNFNAAVTLLFSEIYLANRKPMKAFILLKQSNIIYTNRSMWKVSSNKRDDNIRTQIVTMLLDMFCDTSPEYAFDLFEFLIVNQNSNFYPIDLSSRVNILVSLLLSKNDHYLIVSVGKLIDNYSCALQRTTHRALISSLVEIDLKLAQHLYHNAINLGVYSKMQFHPFMHIIVKSDWTGEEMYLAVLTMMKQLAANIGHAINGITPKQISLHLTFEEITLGTCDQRENKLRASIKLMKAVLEKKFDPPLFMVLRNRGKFYKMNAVSVCKYLQTSMQCF